MRTAIAFLLFATTANAQQLVFSGTTPGTPQTDSYWQAVEAGQAAAVKQMAASGVPDSHVKFDGEREWHADPSATWKAEYVRQHGKGWVSTSVTTGDGCYWCPQCGCYHGCGPGGGQPGRPSQPSPQEEFPQYEPWPPQDTHPPTNPPQTEPPVTQPEPPSNEPPPEPTIDQAALDQFRTEIKNEIQNEISVLVQNEIENVQACDCGPKWAALELRLSGIEGRITDQDANNEAIVIQLQQINATLAGLNNQPPAPSVPADPADEQYYYEIGPHTN